MNDKDKLTQEAARDQLPTRGDELFEQMASLTEAERVRLRKTLVPADIDALLKAIDQRMTPEHRESYEARHPQEVLPPDEQALWDRLVRESAWAQGATGISH